MPHRGPGQEPAPPLGLRRLHDVRPGGAQLPRPEGEVAPAALENGMHGDLLSTEQKAGGGERGGGGGDGAPLLPSPPAQPSRQRQRPRNHRPVAFPLPGARGARRRWKPGIRREVGCQQGEGGDPACLLGSSEPASAVFCPGQKRHGAPGAGSAEGNEND